MKMFWCIYIYVVKLLDIFRLLIDIWKFSKTSFAQIFSKDSRNFLHIKYVIYVVIYINIDKY